MIRTPWGYSVDADALPDVADAEAFDAAYPSTFSATDGQLASLLSRMSAQARDMCGWHLAPSLPCVLRTDGARVIGLPALEVTSVDSVEAGGETVDPSCYEWDERGLVRFVRPCAATRAGWGGVTVRYHAGYDADPAITGAVLGMAASYLSMPDGVRSETAGGTSVTYGANSAPAEALLPYVLKEA